MSTHNAQALMRPVTIASSDVFRGLNNGGLTVESPSRVVPGERSASLKRGKPLKRARWSPVPYAKQLSCNRKEVSALLISATGSQLPNAKRALPEGNAHCDCKPVIVW